MKTTTGTITTTLAANGVSSELGHSGPDVQAVIGVSGTYTAPTVMIEGKLIGGTIWYPLFARDRASGLQVGGASGIAVATSTTTSWLVDTRGFNNIRVYASAGTPTSMLVEIASGQASDFGGVFQSFPFNFSAASSFGAGIAVTGATGTNDLTMPDNLADAFSISEGSNKYITFVTTDSSEGVSVKKDLTMASGTDIIFSGTTGQSRIKLTDNLADALAIAESTNAYITFCTTDSGEKITVAKTTFFSGIVANTGGATAITTTRAVTRADAGGNFTVAQSSAYTITVAQPLGAGERYVFQCVSPGANDVSLVATGCTFEGTITIDAATIPATGSTLKFASGAAILGDNIELISTSTTKFLVRAIGSGAGGITIT